MYKEFATKIEYKVTQNIHYRLTYFLHSAFQFMCTDLSALNHNPVISIIVGVWCVNGEGWSHVVRRRR